MLGKDSKAFLQVHEIEAVQQVLFISWSDSDSLLQFCASSDLKEKQNFEISSEPITMTKVIDTSAEEEEQLSLLVLMIDAKSQMTLIDMTFDRDTDKWSEPVKTNAFFERVNQDYAKLKFELAAS